MRGHRQRCVIHGGDSKIVGDGATDATREISGQGAIGLTAQRIADELPAFPAIGERIVVLHASEQELGFIGRKRTVHHRGQLFAVEIPAIGIA